MRLAIRLPLVPLFILPFAVAAGHGAELDATAAKSRSITEVSAESQALPSPPDKPVPSKKTLKPLIDRTAKQYGVERELVHAVVAAESAYNTHAVSRAGAIGLMQVMPKTAADYGIEDAAALFDPKINLKTGTRHLKRLLKKYKNDYGRTIMAYNAGEGTVDRTNSNVTYAETLDYTAAVIRNYRRNGGKHPTEAAMKKVAMLREISNSGKGRRLMKKYIHPSLLSLSVRSTRPDRNTRPVRSSRPARYLNPRLYRSGPKSKPMIVLDSRKIKR